jgi:DNA-binding transcriptional LysR family regulator
MEQQLDFALFDRVRGRLRPTLRSLALFQEVERSFILNPAVTLSSRSDLADTKAAEGG